MRDTVERPDTSPAADTVRPTPIRDYAAIGDCRGSALVGRDGSIDWCCLRRHDAEPVFCRLLDLDKGGYFAVRPVAAHRVTRHYLAGTNILETVFTTDSGRASVIDFMPVGRHATAGVHDYVDLDQPNWLVRRLVGLEGEVRMRIDYRPSRDWAREPATLERSEAGIEGEGVPLLATRIPLEIEGDRASAQVTLGAGDRHDLVLAGNRVPDRDPCERVDEYLAVTTAFWREWLSYCRYHGPHEDLVRRSALALKLTTYAPSGALVAALTTSLPETIGGVRNWDYRFSWLRDSCFTLYALAAIGYNGEAVRYKDFLADAIADSLPHVRIMYGIEGEGELPEEELDHLAGYADSRPVRIGNGAWDQKQIDVFGQVLDLALLFETLGGRLAPHHRRLSLTLAEFVMRHWHEPDQGLWEVRGPPRHFVHGKLMSWTALDRAVRLFGERREWIETRDRIEKEIHERGIAKDGGHLLQAYDHEGTDAAVLLAPMLGFPLPEGVLGRTIAAARAELGDGPYLHRYKGDDGLPGEEGAFLICSFWLVDALLADGQLDEAEKLFGELAACANDVGLFAEEIDPESHAFLGNFPQAFTQLALVGSAVNLDLARRDPKRRIFGSYADRARRVTGPTFGWRGMVEGMRRCWRCRRVFRSSASVLHWP